MLDPNLSGMISQNVGLAYVISSAEKRHKSALLDLTFHPRDYRERIRSFMLRHEPDVVGLSVTNFSLPASRSISAFIRSLDKRVRIVWGGGYPTLFAEEAIAEPCVDAICIGEGERSFVEYLDRLQEDKAPDVPGIWYKDSNGAVHRNSLRPFEEDLDALPFPNWEHWDIERHLGANLYFLPGAIKFLSSRGCPYDCSFCSSKALRARIPGSYYRQRSPAGLIAEIEAASRRYYQKGFRVVHFADEIFGLHFGFVQAFCSLFKERGLHRRFSWCCATRADAITPQWARTVADAGCAWVWLGIESGAEKIRNGVYKKGISDEQVELATRYLKKQGISYSFSMMVGCPEETKETLDASLSLVKRLRPATADFSFYQPLPKTELGERVLLSAGVRPVTSARQWNAPRIHTQNLSLAQLKRFMWRARLLRLQRFLRTGFGYRGFMFIIDVLRYLFSVGRCRSITLDNPILTVDIELKTIFGYVLDRKRSKAK